MSPDEDIVTLMYRNAVACRAKGRYRKAIDLLRRLIRGNPGEAFFRWELGYTLAYSELGYNALLGGNEALAEVYLKRSEELDDRMPITTMYFYILYSKTGRIGDANKMISKIREM